MPRFVRRISKTDYTEHFRKLPFREKVRVRRKMKHQSTQLRNTAERIALLGLKLHSRLNYADLVAYKKSLVSGVKTEKTEKTSALLQKIKKFIEIYAKCRENKFVLSEQMKIYQKNFDWENSGDLNNYTNPIRLNFHVTHHELRAASVYITRLQDEISAVGLGKEIQ